MRQFLLLLLAGFGFKASAMIVLALDTSLASCSACVYDAGRGLLLAEAFEEMERGQAEALPPMVQKVMAQAHLSYAQLSRIAVTTGPGTFTGIRIGLSFARGLGLTLGVKVVGIDTTKAVEVAVAEVFSQVHVIHQAGASGFFYHWQKNNSTNIEILNLDAILARIPAGEALLVGSGAVKVKELSGRLDLALQADLNLPRASRFVAYAASLPNPNQFPEPTYLRQADAKPQSTALRPLANMALRPVNPETDLATLATLHQTSFDHGWTESDISQMLASPGYAALLAETPDGPAGFILYRMAADEAEIITFAVDPALRRRGAGQALLSHAIAILKSVGLTKLYLDVAATNHEAIGLYRKAGFADAGLRKGYYARTNGPAEDALVLALSLV
ncbi:MAG: tRNA (adenosine(37)-N6)-threonylcarbamoyltransferase complex dimerization subunit type 1 TsaB [Alphaproteobacteria bacterium]|nr:tRNA (adenosine(37)-N6)-threonylcarbamoyltransferase complex dimerization subunit type 1 TsaB [Alphaproteobacteria bacterium]